MNYQIKIYDESNKLVSSTSLDRGHVLDATQDAVAIYDAKENALKIGIGEEGPISVEVTDENGKQLYLSVYGEPHYFARLSNYAEKCIKESAQ